MIHKEYIDKHLKFLIERYNDTRIIINKINDELQYKKIRHENFPSYISENLVKIFLNNTKYLNKKNKVLWNVKGGDLKYKDKKFEIKGFTSCGPLSFGPTENWDKIYFVDAIDIKILNIIIYVIKLNNKNKLWKNLFVNSTETYEQQCNQHRRPRMHFSSICDQLPKKYIKQIYKGNINDIFKFNTKNKYIKMETKKLSMVELCAGTGAFSYVAYKTNKIKTVFANDILDSSELIFNLNNENIKLSKIDIHELDTNCIPTHDILTCGFPCQSFSIAGLKKGFDDERSNVFWKVLSIMKSHNPSIVILENVKNLLSHDNGNTFKTIYDNIINIGYHIKYKVLNTYKVSNIPQNRERIFIICFKNIDTYNKFDFNFDEKENKNNNINSFFESNIKEKYYYNENSKIYDDLEENITEKNKIYQYRRTYLRENKKGICPTLTANMGTGGHNVPILMDEKGIRKLTPRECFNLQGFPSNYKLPDIADGKLYSLAGNAVSIPVIELIFDKLINSL